jgi:hypothetical protein
MVINVCNFEGLYSFAEATKLWGLRDSTLRKAVATGKLIENEDCKKFGTIWIVKESAMIREYGGIQEKSKK